MKYSLFASMDDAEDCRPSLQDILDRNKGGYSGSRWIYVCSFEWNGYFVLPIVNKLILGQVEDVAEIVALLSTLTMVDTLPFIPSGEEQIEP